eukprot:SAG11_NODE_20907_length_436_cov_0.614243_1_plen_74_part_01
MLTNQTCEASHVSKSCRYRPCELPVKNIPNNGRSRPASGGGGGPGKQMTGHERMRAAAAAAVAAVRRGATAEVA